MSLFDLCPPNFSDPICEDPDFNPQDNDVFYEEAAFIRNLIQSEPEGE